VPNCAGIYKSAGMARMLHVVTLLQLQHHNRSPIDSSIYLLISVDKNDAKSCGLESTCAGHGDVVTLADVVDVHWNARVSAYTMLLHQRNQLRLGQVVRWAGLLLNKLQLRRMTRTHGQGRLHCVPKKRPTFYFNTII